MLAIETTGLTMRFDARTAVDQVELTLATGEIRGLLGPNGAGKTTLLRLLFGLAEPDAGTIELLGVPLRRARAAALRQVGGFVEEPSFYPYLSGRANLALLAKLDGGPAPLRIERALARVELDDRAEDRVSGYSTGMRQRLGIAAALLRAPRVLLLDEPTSGLDPSGARAIAALVRELAADGVAVLLSSHQIGELERVCHAYTFLRSGRVVWEGTAERLATEAPAGAYRLSTSDDDRAIALARSQQLVAEPDPAGGLELLADAAALDRYVLALGDARVAVRRLELVASPLESMFFTLTGAPPGGAFHAGALAERALAPR